MKLSLLSKIFICIVLGILLGYVVPDFVVRIFSTFNALFGSFLSFSIPLIILALVSSSIGEFGKGAGRLLLITSVIAYASTLFSGFFTYGVCSAVFGDMISANSSLSINSVDSIMLPSFFEINIPPAIDVMTALVMSFVIGLGLTVIKGETLRDAVSDFKDIVVLLIERAIVPLLPIYVFGVFINMTASGQIADIIKVFLKIVLVIYALHVSLLLIQFTIAGVVSKKNPLLLLRNMLPAYATALGTQSSAATIPVTLKQSIKNGVSKNIAEFTIPLCATIHLSGSTMKIVACAMAIMIMMGLPIHFGEYVAFILMLGITMIAAPGVPGGAIMAAAGVLQTMLGFDETLMALIIALYIAMDSFGTACNVTGDGAIAIVVDKIRKKETVPQGDIGEEIKI